MIDTADAALLRLGLGSLHVGKFGKKQGPSSKVGGLALVLAALGLLFAILLIIFFGDRTARRVTRIDDSQVHPVIWASPRGMKGRP